MSWHLGRLAALDFEATGTDPRTARIVTCCGALVGGETPPEVTSWMVDPQVEIPAEATEIHGITTETARTRGTHPTVALPQIVEWLHQVATGGTPLVVFNAPYDLTLLDRELRRHVKQLGGPGIGGLLAQLRVVDPLAIDKALDRYRKGKRTLEATCQVYGVALNGAHDAAEDAKAAARVAYRMGQLGHLDTGRLGALYADRRYPSELVKAWQTFGRLDLDQLHQAQAGWYAVQAQSFADYLRNQAGLARRRGETTEASDLEARVAEVGEEWPIRVYRGGAS